MALMNTKISFLIERPVVFTNPSFKLFSKITQPGDICLKMSGHAGSDT